MTSRRLIVPFLLAVGMACAGGPQRDDPPGSDGPRSGGEQAPGPVGPVVDPTFRRFDIDQKAHPNAVCNDGTTPVFYVSRGRESDKWVVWFKGGGACFDETSCRGRKPTQTSSTPWKRISLGEEGEPGTDDGKDAGGILSADAAVNPDFHAWNRVYLPYCSSDEWMGTRSASPASYGLHFEGWAISVAILDALRDADIVGAPALKEGASVILAGSSAGANGLRANIDRLASELPGIDVKGFADAGVTPEVTPVRASSSRSSVEAGVKTRLALWEAEGDASCIEALGATEAWRCTEGFTLIEGRHLSTPTFHVMDQRDPKVMGERGDDRDPELARETAAQIREVMRGLSGGFCPASGHHTLLNDDKFSNLEADGLSAADVFGNWYFDRSGPKLLVVEGADSERPARGGRGEGRGDDRPGKRERSQ